MNERRTLPYFSKYEYASLLARRAQQIAENSPLTIRNRVSDNPIEIARQEFENKTIPLKIVREIGDHKEIWSVKELDIIHQTSTISEEPETEETECAEWSDEEEEKVDDTPVLLTQEQIEQIISKCIYRTQQSDVLNNILTEQHDKLRNTLSTVKLKPSKFEIFKQEIINQFHRTIVSPGEAVGVNSAQCIGEPVTQGTLNTFHSAGISKSNVTLGFSRASELFNATSNPSNPLSFVYFKKYNQNPSQLHVVTDKLKEATIDNLIQDWEIYTHTEYPTDWWLDIFMKMNTVDSIKETERCLRLVFDIKKLYSHNLKVKEIANKLELYYTDIRCVYSPLNIGIVDIYVNCEEIDYSKIEAEELSDIKTNEQAIEYYMFNIVSLDIRSIRICGIANIKEIFPRQIQKGEYGIPLKPHIKEQLQNDTEWMIETQGTNLREIFKQPFVDVLRTYSNDFIEMYNIFGIEGARTFLLFEFNNIVSASGGYINPRHIQVLVDKMTHTGEIRAIARYGIETSQYGPISRASFEEVMKHLITSASFSEVDKLNSISSNIALGVKIRAGTGYAKTKKIPMGIKKNGVQQIVNF